MVAKQGKELLALHKYKLSPKLGRKMKKTEFRVEFSPMKFKGMAILSLMFSPLMILSGISLALLPFILPNFESFIFQNKLLDRLLWCTISLLIMFVGYAMGIMSWRLFKHYKTGKPLALLNQEGISGFSPWGVSRFLDWQNIDKINIIRSHGGNFVIYKSRQKKSIMSFIFTDVFAHLNPASISIPLPYTKTKIEQIEEAFCKLNPILEEKFGLKD